MTKSFFCCGRGLNLFSNVIYSYHECEKYQLPNFKFHESTWQYNKPQKHRATSNEKKVELASVGMVPESDTVSLKLLFRVVPVSFTDHRVHRFATTDVDSRWYRRSDSQHTCTAVNTHAPNNAHTLQGHMNPPHFVTNVPSAWI